MLKIPSEMLDEVRKMPAHSIFGLVTRTIFRGRGYKNKRYRTEFDGKILTLYHYRMPILKVDIDDGRVLEYSGIGGSDKNAISIALSALGLRRYRVTLYLARPPKGLIMWFDGVPLNWHGEPISWDGLDEDERIWIKRKKKNTLLRDPTLHWAYRLLYGEIPLNRTLDSNELVVPTIKRYYIRRRGDGRYYETKITYFLKNQAVSE